MICFPGFYLPRFSPAVWMAHLVLCSHLNAVCLQQSTVGLLPSHYPNWLWFKGSKRPWSPPRRHHTDHPLGAHGSWQTSFIFTQKVLPPASLQIKPFTAWFLRSFFSPLYWDCSNLRSRRARVESTTEPMVSLVRILSLPVSHLSWVSQFSSPQFPYLHLPMRTS